MFEATSKRADNDAECGREVTEGSKRCPDCGEIQPLDQFPRHRRRRDGRGEYCKPCHNKRGRESKRRNGGNRHYHLKGKYGVGAAEVDLMIAAPESLCALCRKRPAVQVDHDHETGAVRGILCLLCNAGLGAFRDDPDIIASAIDYLERA